MKNLKLLSLTMSLIIAGTVMCAPLSAQSEPTVYVCGSINTSNGNKAVYWKDGAMVMLSNPTGYTYDYAKSIFVSNNDVYVAGEEHIQNPAQYTRARIWKNGTAEPDISLYTSINYYVSLYKGAPDEGYRYTYLNSITYPTEPTPYPAYPDGSFTAYHYGSSSAQSVYVSNGKVYAAGVQEAWFNYAVEWNNWAWTNGNPWVYRIDRYESGKGAGSKITTWTDGEAKMLFDNNINYGGGAVEPYQTVKAWISSIDGAIEEGLSIFVSGSDVYVAGFEVEAIDDKTNTQPIAKYWKNGVPTALTDGITSSLARSIYVSGSDVYVAGNYGGIARLWKNGVATDLGIATANAVFVSGNDVYVAGYAVGVNGSYACYWKNGQIVNLPLSNYRTAGANSIYVLGNDVYVAGYVGTNQLDACYWKNGVITKLDGGTNLSAISSSTINIFVVGNSPAGINNASLQENSLRARVENGVLHVSGLAAGETWSVYNVAGGLVYQGIAATHDVETLHATSLPERGVYIVKSGNQVVKVVY